MSQSIYTFAVSDRDTKTLAMVQEIKEECKRTGRSFTFVCIEALTKWKEAQDEQRRK